MHLQLMKNYVCQINKLEVDPARPGLRRCEIIIEPCLFGQQSNTLSIIFGQPNRIFHSHELTTKSLSKSINVLMRCFINLKDNFVSLFLSL